MKNKKLFNCEYYCKSRNITLMTDEQLTDRLKELGISIAIDTAQYWYDLESTFYISGAFVKTGDVEHYGTAGNGLHFSIMFEYDGLIEPDVYCYRADGSRKEVPEDIDAIMAAVAMQVAENNSTKGFTKIVSMDSDCEEYISYGEYTNCLLAATIWDEEIKSLRAEIESQY